VSGIVNTNGQKNEKKEKRKNEIHGSADERSSPLLGRSS
jgi:hypothetical protein